MAVMMKTNAVARGGIFFQYDTRKKSHDQEGSRTNSKVQQQRPKTEAKRCMPGSPVDVDSCDIRHHYVAIAKKQAC
jgi:hypothetical protein